MEGPNASGLSATHPQPSNAFDATSHISSHVHVLTHPRSMQPSSPWRWPQSYMYICVCPLSHCLPPSLVVKLPAQLTPSTKWRPGTITSFAPAAALHQKPGALYSNPEVSHVTSVTIPLKTQQTHPYTRDPQALRLVS